MAFKKMVERLTKPVEEIDREQLTAFCDARQLAPMDAIAPRHPVRVGGEVRSVRIVPRAGAPALEVTVSDGAARSSACSSAGARSPGCRRAARSRFEGVVARDGKRYLAVQPGLRAR